MPISLKNILVYMVTLVIDYWNRKSKPTVLQMRKLRHWEGEELAQCHTVTDREETGIQMFLGQEKASLVLSSG